MAQFYTFHLFAGAGGGILADALLGHWPVGAVEVEPYPRGVLLQRQRDGLLPPFPVWDDVRTFRADNPECSEFIDGLRGIRERLVICGGFPCQDISAAGTGAGIASGTRSGLWYEMARIVREVGPRWVFVENSPTLTSRGMGIVLGDLAEMGFDARWGVLGADHVGAPHRRRRIWIHAYARHHQGRRRALSGPSQSAATEDMGAHVSDATQEVGPVRRVGRGGDDRCARSGGECTQGDEDWFRSEPEVGRVAHGVADGLDRNAALGNGQVPAVAAAAWAALK
jgi:DNA (cytosine-5)-methyltransferase 1